MKQEIAQHTPGPWQLSTGIDGAIIHNGVTIASVPLDATAWEANARLIAASPLLLEALDNVFQAAEDDGDMTFIDWKMLRNAYNAATQQ